MDKDFKEIKEEIIIFQNINSADKKVVNGHTNVCMSNNLSEVEKNQSISRAKLREFIMKEGVDFDYWRNI